MIIILLITLLYSAWRPEAEYVWFDEVKNISDSLGAWHNVANHLNKVTIVWWGWHIVLLNVLFSSRNCVVWPKAPAHLVTDQVFIWFLFKKFLIFALPAPNLQTSDLTHSRRLISHFYATQKSFCQCNVGKLSLW